MEPIIIKKKQNIKNWLQQNWFTLLAILFLLGALGSWPYGYYQLLRWTVLAVGTYSAYLAYKSQLIGWTWAFGIIALLFNPIIPFYFAKGTWQVMDIAVAIIFIVSMVSRNNNKNKII